MKEPKLQYIACDGAAMVVWVEEDECHTSEKK
jgi:hypothetical protein